MARTAVVGHSHAISDPDNHLSGPSSHRSLFHDSTRFCWSCRSRYHKSRDCDRLKKHCEWEDLGHLMHNCKEVVNSDTSDAEGGSLEREGHDEAGTIYSIHTTTSTDMTTQGDSNTSAPPALSTDHLIDISPPASPKPAQSLLFRKPRYTEQQREEILASYPVMPFTTTPAQPQQPIASAPQTLKQVLGEELSEPEPKPLVVDENGNVQVTLHRKRKGNKAKKAMYDLTPFLNY